MSVDPAVLKVADAVGALIEAWGFKRNMGRMWAVLYLEDHPLNATELGERLGLSTGAVSMLLHELLEWGAIKKAWLVGERKEHFEAETSIWKMVSRVFQERELQWVKSAETSFGEAQAQLPRTQDARSVLIAERVAGLVQLAQVGAHLLEAMLGGEAIDSLPLKTVGELAKAATPKGDAKLDDASPVDAGRAAAPKGDAKLDDASPVDAGRAAAPKGDAKLDDASPVDAGRAAAPKGDAKLDDDK